jgi:hypothetical protein
MSDSGTLTMAAMSINDTSASIRKDKVRLKRWIEWRVGRRVVYIIYYYLANTTHILRIVAYGDKIIYIYSTKLKNQ